MEYKKCVIIFSLIAFLFVFIIPLKICYGGDVSAYKKFGWPLLGISVIAGVGANYLRKEALKKYDEAEKLWEKYMAIPAGSSYEDFEEAYEKYEDKYAEALNYRNYYLICGGVTVLTAAAGIYLILFSSPNKIVTLEYIPDFYNNINNLCIKVKF